MPRRVDEIFFDPDEIDVAAAWHGGIDSMLYAISSTGALERGTERPYHDYPHRPYTDEEWMDELREQLEYEAEEAADMAAKQAKKARGKNRRQLIEDEFQLRTIARKARLGVSEI